MRRKTGEEQALLTWSIAKQEQAPDQLGGTVLVPEVWLEGWWSLAGEVALVL